MTERITKHKSVIKEAKKTRDGKSSDSSLKAHLKSSKVLKKPYDRLGARDYANYLSTSKRNSKIPHSQIDVYQPEYSTVGPSRNNLEVKQKPNNSAGRKRAIKPSTNFRYKNEKTSLFGNTKASKDALMQASQINMMRNFSPVIDRKLLVDLKANISFKGKTAAQKDKICKKKSLKPQKDYLSQKTQVIKKKPLKTASLKLSNHEGSNKKISELPVYNPRRSTQKWVIKDKLTKLKEESDNMTSVNESKLHHVNSSDNEWPSPMHSTIESHYKSNDDVNKPDSGTYTKEDEDSDTSINQDDIFQGMQKQVEMLTTQNTALVQENQSLRQILNDFEIMKDKESSYLEEIDSFKTRIHRLEHDISVFREINKTQESSIAMLRKEKKQLAQVKARLENELEKENNNSELKLNHFETKNRLLTEALNKRNEDVTALENGNEDLINLLEK